MIVCLALLAGCGGKGKSESTQAVAAAEVTTAFATTASPETTAAPETTAVPETTETITEPETTTAQETTTEPETTEAPETTTPETTETKAPETEPITQPAAAVLSDEEQYQANIFLSNFAEQNGIEHFNVYNSGVTALISFAHTYCKVNKPEYISYEDGFEVMDLSSVNYVTERFLGVDVDEGRAASLPAPTNDLSEYGPFWKDGQIYYQAADGEAYNTFVVVDSKENLGNGTYKMYFKVYEIDLETYFDMGREDFDYYYAMTPEEAAAADDVSYVRDGDAIVTPFDYKGTDTYHLMDYNLR